MSLRHLGLRDFVIVATLDLDLASGFTVLTGETGAGKSILIDALQFVLGERADIVCIREGAQRTEVCAEFDGSAETQFWLEQAGFNGAEDGLLLRRTLDTAGKSRAWVNGSPATASQLRDLGALLLDIHGQHAWQSLLRPASILSLLDAFAGISCVLVQRLWQAWRDAQRRLADTQAGHADLVRERERLSWQLAELEKLRPLANEWQELQIQHQRLSNMQALFDATGLVVQVLSEEKVGAVAALHRAVVALQGQVQHEPEFADWIASLEMSHDQARDVARSAQSWLHRADQDPQRLAELDQRLGAWLSMARQFRCPPADLADVWARLQRASAMLEANQALDQLQSQCRSAEQAYMKEALRLRQARCAAAPLLSERVTEAMQGLGMQGGMFQVQLQALEQAQSHGVDEVSFLVAGHAGSTPRSLSKVASGGELARISLAIAVTTSRLGQVGTLIFDEVDAGVGGAVAETVGRLLHQLGADRQVLAVTHLPQVAACADWHLMVSKSVSAGSTESRVGLLQGDQRVSEVARMLGGERVSKLSLAHASEMLGLVKPPGKTKK